MHRQTGETAKTSTGNNSNIQWRLRPEMQISVPSSGETRLEILNFEI